MKTEVDIIREDLKAAAAHQPADKQPIIRTLRKQLANFAKGNADDKAALRPQIEKSITKIKASRAGR